MKRIEHERVPGIGVRRAVRFACAAILLLAAGHPLRAQTTPPGHIRFIGHTILSTATGEFERWQITDALIDDNHPERSHVSLLIDLDSLNTHSTMRDTHLKSAHFFDVAHYPTATVTLDHVHMDGKHHFTAQVTLHLHGHVQTFPMHFVILNRTTRRIASEVTLRRSDFDLGPHGVWFWVDDNVTIQVDVTVPPPGVIH